MELEHLDVLLVDDNIHMRDLAKTIFRALGINSLRECADGASALRELGKFNADIVVADWVMEPMDGIEFVRRVRKSKNSPNPYLPIIMMTGQTFSENVISARDAGVNGFVAKPISARSLYQRIEDVLERPAPFVRTESYFGPDRRRRDWPVENDKRVNNILDTAA